MEDRSGQFAAFAYARSPALLRTAYLLTGDEHLAQDLLQTALAKTWRAWGRIERKDSADAYVRRVMVTTATSWWRRRWRGEHATERPPETATGHGGRENEVDARLDLVAALRRLPGRQRAVVVLRFYDDMSEADVAQLLGVSVGTVKSQASRGLAKLRADGALEGWKPATPRSEHAQH